MVGLRTMDRIGRTPEGGRERTADMTQSQSRLKRVVERERWPARGATFVPKAQATKVVWFPPKPVDTGVEAVSTAKKVTGGATRKTSGAARKSTGAGPGGYCWEARGCDASGDPSSGTKVAPVGPLGAPS